MSTAVARHNGAGPVGIEDLHPIEAALVDNNLSALTAEGRMQYLSKVCESMGLNPLTRPFQYISLNGKLTLYATRDCTDQLRRLHRISIQITDRQIVGDVLFVTARATDPLGRSDESIGAVSIEGLKGEAKANAYMKAETKAKRRVALSICGLGLMDESEAESVPGAQWVDTRTGVVTEARPAALPAPAEPVTTARVAVATEQQPSYSQATGAGAPTAAAPINQIKKEIQGFLVAIGQSPADAAKPKDYLAEVLGREIAALKDLSDDDWIALHETLCVARSGQIEMMKAWEAFAKAEGHKTSDRDTRLSCINDILGTSVASTAFLTPDQMTIVRERFRMGAEGASPEAQQTIIEAEVVTAPEDPFQNA